MPIIKRKILEGNTIYTDGWKSYDGLILNGYKHYRIYHSKNEFARGIILMELKVFGRLLKED